MLLCVWPVKVLAYIIVIPGFTQPDQYTHNINYEKNITIRKRTAE